METVDPRTSEGLNAMLEQVRASVATEIALADGATELGEREVFAAMGSQEVAFAVTLRERLERLGIVTSPYVAGTLAAILETERYDDRLLAFARHQRATADAARTLLPAVRDYELRAVLRGIEEAHARGAVWCERRAAEFAASRDLDFRTPGRADPGGEGAADEVLEQDVDASAVRDDAERPPRARAGVREQRPDDAEGDRHETRSAARDALPTEQ